jgi:hypothetical protein
MDYDDVSVTGIQYIYEKHLAQSSQAKKLGKIVLILQPSDSPNDPVNWSHARKYWRFLLLMIVTGLAAASSNDAGGGQNAGTPNSVEPYKATTGVLLVGIEYFTLLLSPTAFLYGRKVGYVNFLNMGLNWRNLVS